MGPLSPLGGFSRLLHSGRAAAAAVLLVLLGACGGGGDAPDAEPAAAAAAVASAAVTPAASATAASAASAATTTKTRLVAPAMTNPFRANGWYWNPNESGTGFMFEAQGSLGFVAFFMYEAQTGKPIWYSATGELTENPDGSHAFSGDMRLFSNGQALTSAVYRTPTWRSVGAVQMRFLNGNATVQFPGGRSMQATRFDFAGLNGGASSVQPEIGWYWDPDEGGRGYAVEVQNNQLFMAIFHYNIDGTPTWHTVRGDIASGTLVGTMQLYSGGQTLTSPFQPGGTLFERGSFTLSFRNRCAGQLQRAGAPAVSVRRYVFGDLNPGAECQSVTDGLTDVAGLLAGSAAVMQPGDAMHGKVDVPGDVDAFGIVLQANVAYRFDLQGFTSSNGTLFDPVLRLHDSQLVKLAEDDDSGGELDARITFTPTTSGVYYLVASGYESLTGSFVLSATGVAAGLAANPVPPLASHAGSYSGFFNGGAQGTMALVIDSQGTVTGNTVPTTPGQVPLQLSGNVALGGEVRLTGFGAAGPITFTGFVGPQGDLTGTWTDPAGRAGLFMTGRT